MNIPLIHTWLEFADERRFDLLGTVTVGRAPENGLVLKDEQISRRHAIIQAQGEREFWLVDLGSANGTYVNERRISQPVQLHRGDIIRIAQTRMEYHSELLTAAHPAGRKMVASTMMSIRQLDCWLMVADIISSTKLAQELPAEELPRVTGNWFKSCRQVVEECGGHMSKYLGDGFFCYWEAGKEGRSQLSETLAGLRAMQAAASPPFRVVLHYGPAVLGSVPTMAEMNLHGPEVNFVFRIEKVAGSLGIPVMLSERAHEKLGSSGVQVAEAIVDGFRGKFRFFTAG